MLVRAKPFGATEVLPKGRLWPSLALIAAGGAALAHWGWAPERAVRRAFSAWRDGAGSIYDLMEDEAAVVIPGTAAHCGVFRKDVFLGEIAAPFVARFATPPVPQLRAIWSGARAVVALADAKGLTRDDRPYANTYLFVFEMRGRRAIKVTEFLDMAAFNAVWDGVEPTAADHA